MLSLSFFTVTCTSHVNATVSVFFYVEDLLLTDLKVSFCFKGVLLDIEYLTKGENLY